MSSEWFVVGRVIQLVLWNLINCEMIQAWTKSKEQQKWENGNNLKEYPIESGVILHYECKKKKKKKTAESKMTPKLENRMIF